MSSKDTHRLTKAVFCGAVEGQRERGGSRTRRKDNIDNVTETPGLNSRVVDRKNGSKGWRLSVEQVHGRLGFEGD